MRQKFTQFRIGMHAVEPNADRVRFPGIARLTRELDRNDPSLWIDPERIFEIICRQDRPVPKRKDPILNIQTAQCRFGIFKKLVHSGTPQGIRGDPGTKCRVVKKPPCPEMAEEKTELIA